MNLEHFNLNVIAESREKALEKIKEHLVEEDEEMFKLDINPSLNEIFFDKNKAISEFSFSTSDFWFTTDFSWSASNADKEAAKKIYETLHQPLEDQAVSFKPDDRGRINLGTNYSDKKEVKVIILE